ncbi:MAG: PD40 domain-containing protein [Anaerolineaceae bacterium]|nr:PD40 domain-containing protein [Anaerolineaceae bacterium]
MNNEPQTHGLEDEIRSLFAAQEPSPAFSAQLGARLSKLADTKVHQSHRVFILRPVWGIPAALLLLMLVVFFIIGPKRVYAEVRRMLGYIPDVGLVDSSSPIRVLAEPVEQTRNGINITVRSAVLTADRTHIEYLVFGVPRDAYPASEDISGCIQQEYLLLPDGTRLERTNDYPAVPADVNEAVLVIPCIPNTLPGTVPDAWSFPLKFVPAPPDMTVMPVEEVVTVPTFTPEPTAAAEATPTAEASKLAPVVERVIETEDGYVLIVAFNLYGDPSVWVQQTGPVVLTDAAGKKVAYSIPLDIQNSLVPDPNGADLMAYKFDAAGVQFPLTITYPGVTITVPDPDATVSFTFDAGSNPQPGQEWRLNQQLELAGHMLTLVSVDADSRRGYSFHFKADPHVNGVQVSIEGYTPNGGGGGGGAGMTNGEFSVSLSYPSIPAGSLNVTLSNLSEVSETLLWSTMWSPTTPRNDLPSSSQLSEGMCANSSTVTGLPSLPASFTGEALISRFNDDGANMLSLVNLDGSIIADLSTQGHWAATSADGTKAGYFTETGFTVYDIASGVKTIFTISGYNPYLSTRGTLLAYIDPTASGVYLADLSNGTSRQISGKAYSAVIGWAPDDSEVYVAEMAAGGAAWQIQSIEVQSGQATPLFLIENGSYKALNAALSPDGQWIAYRSRENSSVYLVSIDGSQNRLLLDSLGLGISGITWSADGWLAVSTILNYSNEELVILVNPATCEIYQVTGLRATIKGINLK